MLHSEQALAARYSFSGGFSRSLSLLILLLKSKLLTFPP